MAAFQDWDLVEYPRLFPGECLNTKTVSDSPASHSGSAPHFDTLKLHKWLEEHVVTDALKSCDTIALLVDTQHLSSYSWFESTIGELWHQRSRWMFKERMHVVFVCCSEDNGLLSCHMTHAIMHVARSLRARFRGKHIIASDADCGPTALMEVWQQVQLARSLEALRDPRRLPEGHMPGLIVHNEKKHARANAGLLVSIGVGDRNQGFSLSPEHWCKLLDDRMVHLLLRAQTPDVGTNIYSDHVQSWSHGTPLAGIVVEEPQDYLHLLAEILNVINKSAWHYNALRSDKAALGAFSDSIRLASPPLNGWAGPFCEQPALALLEAFQSSGCYISYFSSELGFMKQYVSQHMGTCKNVLQPAVMPPLYVHAYGKVAKRALVSLVLGYWVTMSESLNGSLHWRPNFLECRVGESLEVCISAGFKAIAQVPDIVRSFRQEQGWVEVPPSNDVAFTKELNSSVRDAATWPLWSVLVQSQSRAACPIEDHQMMTVLEDPVPSDVTPAASHVIRLDVECPGLSRFEAISSGGLFETVAQLIFQNVGDDAVYGPTREPAISNSYSRVGDVNVNALHYILRDQGCQQAWGDLVSRLGLQLMPGSSQLSSVPFCHSWHAKPCGAVILGMLALVCQFTKCADSWLSLMLDPLEAVPMLQVTPVVVPAGRPLLAERVTSMDIRGFSAGSYTATLLFRLLQTCHESLCVQQFNVVVGALALPPCQMPKSCDGLHVVHVLADKACVWHPSQRTIATLLARRLKLTLLSSSELHYVRNLLKKSYHNYSFMVLHFKKLPISGLTIPLQQVLATLPASSWSDNGETVLTYLAWAFAIGAISGDLGEAIRQFTNPQGTHRSCNIADGVEFDADGLRQGLTHLMRCCSAEHMSFLTSVVLPWMASQGDRRPSSDVPDIFVGQNHGVIRVYLEILGRLGPRTALVKLWFPNARQDLWASWSSIQPGFFNGQIMEGTLNSQHDVSSDDQIHFSGVVRDVRKVKSWKSIPNGMGYAAIQEIELLAQFSKSHSEEDVLSNLYNQGPMFRLVDYQKHSTRIVPEPRARLLFLDPALLRIVYGRHDLPEQKSIDPQLHPKARTLASIALSWEYASQRLQLRYPSIIVDIANDDFSGLRPLICHGQSSDECLRKVWAPLEHLGDSFGRVFWKILSQKNSVLPLAQAHMALSMWQRIKGVHIQGVPGSGKTTVMAILAIVNCVQADLCILWTALNVNAVKEGALTIASLLENAPPDVRSLFVRFLGKKHECECFIDVPFMQRRVVIGNSLMQKAGPTITQR